MGRRSMTASSGPSASGASGSAGVETINSPRGNRRASSLCIRAIPPPMGGKSWANSMVVITRSPIPFRTRVPNGNGKRPSGAIRSGLPELPVDPDEVGRDPIPVVVGLHRRSPGGTHASPQAVVAQQAQGRGRDRRRIVGIHEQPGLALAYRFGDPTGTAGDDRQSTRGRFHDGDTESLDRKSTRLNSS